jgi:hypothetical protein
MEETVVETSRYGRMGSKGFYKHYPSFLRLFRYEFDALLGNSEFAAEVKRYIFHYVRPSSGTPLQNLVDSDVFEFSDADKERLFKALRQIGDKKEKFWGWFHQILIWCRFLIFEHYSYIFRH